MPANTALHLRLAGWTLPRSNNSGGWPASTLPVFRNVFFGPRYFNLHTCTGDKFNVQQQQQQQQQQQHVKFATARENEQACKQTHNT